WRHRKTRQEVGFHEPDRIKSHLIGQDALFERLFNHAMIVQDWPLHPIRQPDSHASLPSKLKKHMRAAPTGMAYCRKAGGRTQHLPHEHGLLTKVYDSISHRRAEVWKAGVHGDSIPSGHCSHRMTGTVERLLNGDPSTTRVLYARYTSVRCARSTIRT